MSCLIVSRITKYLNEKESFDQINQNYQDIDDESKKIINQLQIYPDNFSRSYSTNKKEKVLLIISGFRDTPKMWERMEIIFKQNKIDYVIPRINGFGRTFFEYDNKWNNWVITIMEHMNVLQNLYEQVNIIGFSTGCNIGFYISQFNWNCKINNMIFCCPNFVINPGDLIYKTLLKLPIISHFFLIVYPVCHRPYESRLKKSNKKNSIKKFNIFYEKNFPLSSAIEMWRFQDVLPSKSLSENVVIVKANNDKLIGDINQQKALIENITKKNINIINIPSKNTNKLVGHNIFNSSDDILDDFYKQIINFI